MKNNFTAFIMKKRLVFIYDNLAPYHYARLSALAKYMPNILAIQLFSKAKSYIWQKDFKDIPFELKTLFSQHPDEVSRRVRKEKVITYLSEISPEIIFTAGYTNEKWQLARWAKGKNIPSVLLLSSTENDNKRIWLKEYLKSKVVISSFSAVAATGKRAADYAKKLGFNPQKIYKVGNVIDNNHFARQAQIIRQEPQKYRKALALPENYFLTVSRLSPEKNHDVLIEAFRQYRASGGKWNLVIIGSGPLEGELSRDIKQYDLKGVHLAGWQNQDLLPGYYSLADCFVLPSLSEPWGLVVNEAMACRLPILLSNTCGCQPELCKRNVNGYDFSPEQPHELKELMHLISADIDKCQAMGKASEEMISNFTPQSWANKLIHCIDSTLEGNLL